MSFPNGYIEALLARVDIVEVVRTFLPLEPNQRWKNRHGSYQKGEYIRLCPLHSEENPSFTVSSTKQFFHCFGCAAHGNVIVFLEEYQRMSYYDAVMYLARRYHFYPRQHRRRKMKNI